jgi:hypothetical protein
VVVSLHSTTVPPAELCAWAEAWLARRQARDGLLIAILGRAPLAEAPPTLARDYLVTLARRARLDFLLQDQPFARPPALPLLDEIEERAQNVTHVLSHILAAETSPPPPGWATQL